ncbi:MAG: epoxyqueuosine reductase QueH [candidate division NC10 bacterium]|nr:epoxyqueuosine reductase QueH [candidate division NC10 bacterium]
MSGLSRPRILLHICCAPDATVVIERLASDYRLTGFFYNPNIHPEEEYSRRLGETIRLAEGLDFPLFLGDYDPVNWFSLVRGFEGEPEGGTRCEICIRMRLERTAALARDEGFTAFSTVLTVSPHKQAPFINRVGAEVAARHGLSFFGADFKKKDGFKRSLELSKRHGLYRQKYCGCIYSLEEREASKGVGRGPVPALGPDPPKVGAPEVSPYA